MAPPPSGLGRGERAPDFVLPLEDGTPTRFYARAGGMPAVLLFCPADQAPQLLPFATTLAYLAARPLALFAVQHGRPAATLQAPFPVFTDAHGTVTAAYRLGQTGATTCVVLSPQPADSSPACPSTSGPRRRTRCSPPWPPTCPPSRPWNSTPRRPSCSFPVCCRRTCVTPLSTSGTRAAMRTESREMLGVTFKTPVEWPVLFICHSNPEKPPYACQTATRHV